MEILEKTSDVVNEEKRIVKSLDSFQKKVNEFEPPDKLMPESTNKTL